MRSAYITDVTLPVSVTRLIYDLHPTSAGFRPQRCDIRHPGRPGRNGLVYPGPADDLKAHVREFLQNKELPRDFLFVTDPDYTFTNAYGLRWEATRETAYPSTLIIAKGNKVRFAHVSMKHGDRVDSTAALWALADAK